MAYTDPFAGLPRKALFRSSPATKVSRPMVKSVTVVPEMLEQQVVETKVLETEVHPETKVETKVPPGETKLPNPETKVPNSVPPETKLGRGRPSGGKPWEAAGMSRAAWYRAKKAKG